MVIFFLILITALCAYIIMYVGLGWFGPLGEADNYVRINNVLLNISYSYLAGLIFYLFTSTLPYYLNSRKLKSVISDKKSNIYGRIVECIKSPFPPMTNCDNLSDNAIISQFEKTSIYTVGYHAMSVYDYLRAQRTDIKNIIKGLVVYSSYLSADDIETIEKINDSMFFNQINVFQYNLMDKPEHRKKLGEYLTQLVSLSSKFKS